MQQVKGSSFRYRTPAGGSNQSITFRGLIFVGVGGIIGGGFFLGCGLPIRMAGPAVLLAFVIGGLITAQVIGALTSIAVNHPVKGSFAAYANTYLGHFAGFLQGWTYYLTGILTIASEAVAMGIFTQLWLPVPVWLSATIYSVLIVLLNAFGLKNFTRVESVMSAVKIAALVGFIIYAVILALSFWFGTNPGGLTGFSQVTSATAGHGFMPTGFRGLAQSMLIVIFAYAGIGVFATAAAEIKNPAKIDSAALWTVVILSVLYIGSIALLLCLIPWNQVNTSTSPFVSALDKAGIRWFGAIFNGVILVAAFSVMAGALYSANQVLYSLGTNREAPRFVTKVSRRGTELGAFCVTVGCIAITLTVSLLLPANVYNFLVSASSFFTFFNWFVILWTFLMWRKHTHEDDKFTSRLAFGQPASTVITMVVLLVLAGYALFQPDQRLGFYASLAIGLVVSLCYYCFIGRKNGHGAH